MGWPGLFGSRSNLLLCFLMTARALASASGGWARPGTGERNTSTTGNRRQRMFTPRAELGITIHLPPMVPQSRAADQGIFATISKEDAPSEKGLGNRAGDWFVGLLFAEINWDWSFVDLT